MKKLIYTILASSFLLSCSSDSASDDSNNSTNTGMLVKTFIDSQGLISTFNYNGNKGTYVLDSDGSISTLTYNGDLIIKDEKTGGSGSNYIRTMNYSNNLLTSSTESRNSTSYSSSYNSTYTYNSDGSITEIRTGTNTYNGNTTNFNSKYIRFYSQGNCVKEDSYRSINGVMTLTETTTYTYDSYNFPFKNITGLYADHNPQEAASVNNKISETTKNASGEVILTVQTTYQYNSQNYPISMTDTITNYTPDPQTGTWTPETPETYSATFTYY
ncbi:hypothetical protein [Flavobacterium sp.]|jgi:hypothetical protein|uniref:hypothetical protein n=1 Tax=Flavobacterium sp. TaxID=239 RepID=UPI0037BE9990